MALHAVESVVHAPLELGAVMPIGEMDADLRVEFEHWLERETHEAGGQEFAECKVSLGEPVHEIMKAIEREGTDLVVIGSHGGPSPVAAVLGSVARAVLWDSRGPVFVVGPLSR